MESTTEGEMESLGELQGELNRNLDEITKKLNSTKNFILERFKKIEEEKAELERNQQELIIKENKLQLEKENWEQEKKKVLEMNLKLSDIIWLNVRGEVFATTRNTLCSLEDSMLAVMFSGRHHLKIDSNGHYVIDRDPVLFRYILQYLRNGRLDYPKELENEIMTEFDYFCVPLHKKDKKNVKFQMVKELKGHLCPVGCLGVVNNGTQLVSGSNDNTLKVWDLKTGQNEKTLTGHTGSVYTLKVWKDHVITGSHDKRIKIWDINTGVCVSTLNGHNDRVWCLQISADEKTLVSGSADNTIKAWDLTSLHCFLTLKGHRSWIRCIDMVNNVIYSGSDDNDIRSWDLDTGYCLQTFKGHDESVFSLAISGDLLISGAKDQTIRIWDRHTGQIKKILFGHTRPVYCIQTTPEGYIISGSWDSTIRIWDVTDFNCLQILTGHAKAVYSVLLSGDVLITGSADNLIGIWEKKEIED
eukprot:TRINITY_DN21693_c0_g1_i1.p1 TRINITY_DN21693_c0_g1~~TRINITY_DN21693_c0_g1_i1.p1  ORF type:complete len:472 (-),score=112.61 TRINITY_DN21693_c0_g1_i1:36-1451(-)